MDESDRFIGPGYYESRTFLDELKAKPSTNASGFTTKDSWFIQAKGFQNEKNPGPGHYEVSDVDKWHKPSFNIIFED